MVNCNNHMKNILLPCIRLISVVDLIANCPVYLVETLYYLYYHFLPSAIICPWLDFGLPLHRLCGVIERRLSRFLPRWLRTGWQSAISQGKIPWNTSGWLGIESGPRGGQTVRYPTEVPWLTLSLSGMICQLSKVWNIGVPTNVCSLQQSAPAELPYRGVK